jgi:hypothetical protein
MAPMRFTRGLPDSAGRFLRARAFFSPNSFHSQRRARSALCHWSSSMVRGRKRSRLLPSGVTPPPIISAMEPVTTTAGRSGSSVALARRRASSVPLIDSSSSPIPVTTMGSSCGGSASV